MIAGPLQQELIQTAVDDYYNSLAQRTGQTPALGCDYSKFELIDGRLRLKAYPGIKIVNARNGKPLALSTVSAQTGGGSAIQDGLGWADWRRKQQLPSKAVVALQTADNELGGVDVAIDSIELQDLGQTATEASDAVHKALLMMRSLTPWTTLH